MAGWTKADYDDAYLIRAERRHGGHPGSRREVKLNYHREVMLPFHDQWWSTIIPILGLTSADRVVLVGAGFGWGVEKLEEKVPGITVVGVDISDYIHDEKNNDERVDVEAACLAVGLGPTDPRTIELVGIYVQPGPRMKVNVRNEDLLSNGSRNRIRQALGNTFPTRIITEDMIQTLTDAEIAAWKAEIDPIGAEVIHAVSGSADLTAINAKTGHKVIHMNSGEVVGP